MSMTDKRPHETDPLARRRMIMAVQLAGLAALALLCLFLVFEAMQVG